MTDVFFFCFACSGSFLLFVNDEFKTWKNTDFSSFLSSDSRGTLDSLCILQFVWNKKKQKQNFVLCVGCDVTSWLPMVRSNIDNFDETFDWEIFDLYTNCVICCCVRMFFFLLLLPWFPPCHYSSVNFILLDYLDASITLRIYSIHIYIYTSNITKRTFSFVYYCVDNYV